jgi:hypothetical protein
MCIAGTPTISLTQYLGVGRTYPETHPICRKPYFCQANLCLNPVCFRQILLTRLPSRPGVFHPEALTDPDMNLSIHPARATARRLPPSAKTSRFLPFPVDLSFPTSVACPRRSTGITLLLHYHGQSAPSERIGTFSLGVLPLAPFPLPSPARFSSSVRKPRGESRRLYTGHRMASR